VTDYYLSAAGNDSNDGTLTSPWATLTRLNTAFAGGVGLNNRVFLRRGDTFHGLLRTPSTINPANPGWLKIGAYGTGSAPVISGYKILNTASGWVQEDADTWKVDYSAANHGVTYTGYNSAQGDGDVGFLKVDEVLYGAKKASLASLTQQWDFYSTGTTLYVRSSAKPTTLAADVRCTVDGDGWIGRSGVELRNLAILGHGACGVRAPGEGQSTRIRIIGCEIGEVGGSYLSGTTRYGNGINVWNNSADVHCEHNVLRDCYDTAWSIQGGADGAPSTFTNITWRRNLVYRNAQSEEYWRRPTGPGFINCVSEYNTNLFAGYGWGSDYRSDTDVRVHVLNYGWGTGNDLTLRRNIYYDARGGYRYSSIDPAGLVSSRNVIALRPETVMLHGTAPTIEDGEAWAAMNGRDTDSQFVVIPAGGTSVSDSDVTDAIAALDDMATTGQKVGAKIMPIHSPWRAA
jgi:hypothetical protein